MKSYSKPQMEMNKFSLKENVASINDWLTTGDYTTAGITTYLVQS